MLVTHEARVAAYADREVVVRDGRVSSLTRSPVIRLGLRLTVGGGREAVVRLVILTAAVGLGVGLLLIALSGINAVKAQNDRYAWLRPEPQEPAAPGARRHVTRSGGSSATTTSTEGPSIRVDVAATGPTSPVPPGIPRDPGPGQYYASPALRLLDSTPAMSSPTATPGA